MDTTEEAITFQDLVVDLQNGFGLLVHSHVEEEVCFVQLPNEHPFSVAVWADPKRAVVNVSTLVTRSIDLDHPGLAQWLLRENECVVLGHLEPNGESGLAVRHTCPSSGLAVKELVRVVVATDSTARATADALQRAEVIGDDG